jgi:hypothetical protein
MVSQIREKGYIVIETPDFGGFHHQHLYFFSLPFYKRLAEKYGIRLVDCNVYEGNIIAVFSNSTPPADCEGETLEELASRAKLKQKAVEEHINKFRDFVKKHKEIYMWGTGSFAIILLSQLRENELKDKVIIPIDTDKNRSGYVLANIAEPVRHAKDMTGSKPEALAIASQFTGEIKKLIAGLDIIADDVLEFFP